jgi:hypothetical protein
VDSRPLSRAEESTMPKSHKPYPPEFKQRLIDLVRAGRNPEELAEQFEPSALRRWTARSVLVRCVGRLVERVQGADGFRLALAGETGVRVPQFVPDRDRWCRHLDASHGHAVRPTRSVAVVAL